MVNNGLKTLNIDIITKLGVKKSTVNKLHKLKIKTFGDLDKVEEKAVLSIIESDNTITASEFASALKLNLLEFIDKLSETATSDPAYEMALLHIQNRTYQEIAAKYNIGKDKAVQSIDKFLQSLYSVVDALGEELIMDKACISIDDLEKLFKSEDFCAIILLAFKARDTKWTYDYRENLIRKKA